VSEAALHQLIAGEPPGTVERLVVTASGGPFRGRTAADLEDVSIEDALAHPTWAMGGKITIDSATLMNKGLEVIEAHFLFGTPYERIDVVVHPQSIVHAMVTLVDGRFSPIPFDEMLDPQTGRTRVRLVDTSSEQYQIARRYMVRLRHEDLENAQNLARLASVVSQTPEQFRTEFDYVAE